MERASLLSLDDAVLDIVICKLVELCGTAGAVVHLCMVNRRFSALVKQPLGAWQTLSLSRGGTGTAAPHVTAAYLARWLHSVAPGVERLVLEVGQLGSPPGHQLAVSPFLASARTLKVRFG